MFLYYFCVIDELDIFSILEEVSFFIHVHHVTFVTYSLLIAFYFDCCILVCLVHHVV